MRRRADPRRGVGSLCRGLRGEWLPARQLLPCYGLAEATLFLTGNRPREGADIEDFDAAALERGEATPADTAVGTARRLVGCGFRFRDTDIRIVDEHGKEVPDGRIGEIWASGPGLASGYWRRAKATREPFAATLPQAPGRVVLRTGDLGFFRNGQLFISGRVKDLIIIDGRNIAPQDLEWTAGESHSTVVGAAAFAVSYDDVERAVLLAEIEGRLGSLELEAIGTTIRRTVAAAHDLPLAALALTRLGSLARTTSGKPARSRCRRAHLDDELCLLHHWRSSDMPPDLPTRPWARDDRVSCRQPAPCNRYP
ncbi:AMP-binding protein [Inquilinus limosus]|uniref:AMP-binding protein n=1 Tax=Inquilinus limosus TaxID=171674 RepID=UPI003F5CD2F0